MFEWPHRPQIVVVENEVRKLAPFYIRWASMKSRCLHPTNESYKHYGARGITICEEWMDFWNYYDWCLRTYEPHKSIDRINNDGPYSPDNCKWSTPKQQIANSRQTDEKKLTCRENQKKTIAARHKVFGDPRVRSVKICSTCKEFKKLKMFSKSKNRLDGRHNRCKMCDSNYYLTRRK